MALSDETSGGGIPAVMNVAPTGYGNGYPIMGGYGNGGFGGLFGGDGAYLLLLLLLCGGGWGGLGGFGMGGMMWPMMMGGMGAGFGLDYLYPWLNNSQHISDGFRDQQLNSSVQGLQSAVTSGFGDVQLGIAGVNQNISSTGAGIQNSLCNGFAGVNQNVSNVGANIQNSLCNGFAGVNLGMANGFSGVNQAIASTAAQGEVAANGRHSALTGQLYNNEIANLNRSFAEQTANTQGFNTLQGQLANCCCDQKSGIADLKYVVASENCADRTAAAQNTRDIIDAQTRGTQAILDKLCQLELDGYKTQVDAKNDTINQLRSQLQFASMQASQVDQTAQLRASQATTANQLVSELRSCPIPAQPVYGNQPIFTCPNNNYGGCGCNAA